MDTYPFTSLINIHIDYLVQDCGISSAKALEIPQSSTKPSISIPCPPHLINALPIVFRGLQL